MTKPTDPGKPDSPGKSEDAPGHNKPPKEDKPNDDLEATNPIVLPNDPEAGTKPVDPAEPR